MAENVVSLMLNQYKELVPGVAETQFVATVGNRDVDALPAFQILMDGSLQLSWSGDVPSTHGEDLLRHSCYTVSLSQHTWPTRQVVSLSGLITATSATTLRLQTLYALLDLRRIEVGHTHDSIRCCCSTGSDGNWGWS
jgi:hypothetical protein